MKTNKLTNEFELGMYVTCKYVYTYELAGCGIQTSSENRFKTDKAGSF